MSQTLKLTLTSLLMFFSLVVFAQEICDNGIDDDADGLIDLQDDDCDCEGLHLYTPSSHFPNPSFEENSCLPGIGAVACADGWISPSAGTPDYWGRCGQTNVTLPTPPCPMPDGDKCFGIVHNNSNGILWKEYVGTILNSPLMAGETYILSFWIGFSTNPLVPDFHYDPFDLQVFAHVDASSMPFDTATNCPKNAPDGLNWDILGNTWISSSEDGWKQFSIEFTPTKDYAVVIIGPSCDVPSGNNYYFLDNLILASESSFTNDFISRKEGLMCNGDLVLTVPEIDGINYQWYKDGIALVGETGIDFNVPEGATGAGSYCLVLSNPFGCSISNEFIVEYEEKEIIFTAPAGFCEGELVEIGTTESYESYRWSGGESDTSLIITNPDEYSLTVTDAEGCEIQGSLTMSLYPDIQYHLLPTNETAPGAGDGMIDIVYDEIISNPVINWWDGDMSDPKQNLSTGEDYCVTVTADNRCPIVECADVYMDIQPIIVSETIGLVSCNDGSDGFIHLELSGGLAPFDISWQGMPQYDGRMNLNNLKAGNYTLVLVDGEMTRVELTYTVEQPEALRAFHTKIDPACFEAFDGSISIDLVEGGNGAYEYYWNGSNVAGGPVLAGLNKGTYSCQILDAKDCVLDMEFELVQPDQISATIEIDHPACIGSELGGFRVKGIKGGTGQYKIFANGLPFESDNSLYALEGETNYTIEVIDENNCRFYQEAFLAYQSIFEIELGENKTVDQYDDVPVEIVTSHELGLVEWSGSDGFFEMCDGCGFLEVPVSEDMLLVVTALTPEGCIDADSIALHIRPEKKVFIPNAFSPNNDGVNDRFEIFSNGEVAMIKYMKIFSQSGSKVYDVSNIPPDHQLASWNSMINGQEFLPGTYIYMIELEFKDGRSTRFSGDLTLLK